MVVAGRKKNAKSDDNFESVEIFQKVRGPNSFVHKTKKRKTTQFLLFILLTFSVQICCYFFTRCEINIKYLRFLVPKFTFVENLFKIHEAHFANFKFQTSAKWLKKYFHSIFYSDLDHQVVKIIAPSSKYQFCIRLQSLLLSVLWIRQ